MLCEWGRTGDGHHGSGEVLRRRAGKLPGYRGSSNPDKVVSALEIITSDPNVKAILFNIFGGITRCDDVANGIVEATKRIDIEPPIVIRLTGTNEDLGLQILEEAGFSAYTSMDDVVEKAVELAKG